VWRNHPSACTQIAPFWPRTESSGNTAAQPFFLHCGELFLHRWDEPVNDLIAEAEKYQADLVTPLMGESLDFSLPVRTAYWWQDKRELAELIDYSTLAQVQR